MYNVSTALSAALARQRLYMRVTCGAITLDADRVTNCNYSASCGGGDTVSIGGVTAAAVTLTIKGRVELLNQTIAVEVGALVSEAVQYIPLGTFTVTDCQQGEDSTTVTGYDAAYCDMGVDYVPTVASGSTVAAVLKNVADQCSLTLATLPAAASTTAVTGDLTGHTCREMAGLAAALVGCNVLIDRSGALALRWFTDSGYAATTDDYYDGGLALSGAYTLACIACTVTTKTTTTDEDGTISETETQQTLSAGGTGSGISIENPYMTQSILNAVWVSIGGLSYKTGSCNLVGGLLLEPGDLITVTDVSGASHTIPVMSVALTIDGGCKAAVSAVGESSSNNGANFTGGLSGATQQIVADIAKIKNLSAENITAIKAKIDNLYADNAWVENLFGQNITASGTIKGATLDGAKLTGEAIDIESSDESGTTSIKTAVDGSGNRSIEIYDSGGSAGLKSYIIISNGTIRIAGQSLEIDTDNLVSTANFIDSKETYTTFDGDVVSSGNIVVIRFLGCLCLVAGNLTMSGTLTTATKILDATKVPANLTGTRYINASNSNKSSWTRPLAVRVTASGGLDVNYGAAGRYDFSMLYFTS